MVCFTLKETRGYRGKQFGVGREALKEQVAGISKRKTVSTNYCQVPKHHWVDFYKTPNTPSPCASAAV